MSDFKFNGDAPRIEEDDLAPERTLSEEEAEQKEVQWKWHQHQRDADPDGLTGLERRFCEEYLYDFDPEAAYIRADGKGRYPRRNATALLKSDPVSKFIKRRLKERNEKISKHGIDPHAAIHRIMMLARADLSPFMDEHGEVDMTTSQAQANIAMLSEYSVKEHNNGVKEHKIKLIDPLQACKAALTAAGAFSQKERDMSRNKKQQEDAERMKWFDPEDNG